jgi:hypothetical protein
LSRTGAGAAYGKRDHHGTFCVGSHAEPAGNVYSIGDLLIAAGGAALVYSATRRPYAG